MLPAIHKEGLPGFRIRLQKKDYRLRNISKGWKEPARSAGSTCSQKAKDVRDTAIVPQASCPKAWNINSENTSVDASNDWKTQPQLRPCYGSVIPMRSLARAGTRRMGKSGTEVPHSMRYASKTSKSRTSGRWSESWTSGIQNLFTLISGLWRMKSRYLRGLWLG